MSYLKVLDRSAVFAWSPGSQPISYLAAGTNAQQVDSSFNTASAIDLCCLDFAAEDAFQPNVRPVASGQADFRFHRLVWSELGGKLGTLIGGCENGAIVLYDPAIKLENDQSSSWCIKQSRKHSSAVRTLDVNPYQKQLLASGASNGEVFIFDLNNIDQPMTPGPRPSSEPQQSAVSVGWNARVEHILATLFPSYAYVWDLRRSDGPIMKLGDLGGGRGQWTTLKWHPDSSTTFCLASGDDHYPVVQMWDVRFANAACAQLEGHQRGILSMDWCAKDSDMLITCGKDMKIYIWNPNTSQYLSEIPLLSSGSLVHSWPFEVQWSKRDPNLVGVASFDGRIAVYSLSGAVAGLSNSGLAYNITPAPTPKLAESFPSADFAFQPAAVQKMLQERQQQVQNLPRVVLPVPPKWMRIPCGARFGFGGKLISFSKPEPNPDAPEATRYNVDVSQVITEPSVYERASELEMALNPNGSNLNLPVIAELCGRRAVVASNEAEKSIWLCLQAHVQRQGRQKYAEIAGAVNDVQELNERLKRVCNISLSKGRSTESEPAVNGSTSDSSYGADSTQEKVLQCYEEDEEEAEDEAVDVAPPWPLPAADEIVQFDLPMDPNAHGGLLCQLVSACKIATAVEVCIAEDRWTDAIQLSSLGSSRLYSQTQRRYYERLKDPISKFICLLSNERWDWLVSSVSVQHPDSWRFVFSILLKYVQSNELADFLEQLGKRMEATENEKVRSMAAVCYIASGWVEQLVENLSTKKGNSKTKLSAEQLHDIVEKATILRVSMGGGSQRSLEVGPKLADRLSTYATLLVEQGCLSLALHLLDALPDETEQSLMELRHRVYMACAGYVPANVRRPKVPFASKTAPQYQQQQSYQGSIRSRSGSFAPQPNFSTAHGQLYGSNANVPSQYGHPPPPVVPSGPGQQAQQTSAVMATRNRYPSYNTSDGISYPTAPITSPAVSQFPTAAVSPSPYPAGPSQYQQPVQQQPTFAAATPIYQQQQPPPPPPPTVQQTYAAPHKPAVVAHSMASSIISHHHPAAVQPPQLPPPPPGPAVTLNHRPWNDPPPLSPKKKSPTKKTDVPTPVTYPFLSAGGVPQSDQGSPQYPSQPQQQQQIMYQQPFAYQQPQPQQSAQPSPSPSPAPAPVVPAEHEIILSVLRRLGELTAAQAPNVQTRRRIEDSLQKLNANLPNLIASAKLSKTTLTELHQLVDYIRAYDYNSSLALHHRIIEGSDFSVIASFMPSVKVLIQSAAQLGVYYS